jgi:ATP-dependent phosphoenolpyruvate carboxykinase
VREVGTNPFIVGSRGEEGNLFYRILKKNPHIQCFLFNTGGFGGRQVDVSRQPLTDPDARDFLTKYLGGFWHEDKGFGIQRELIDGSSEWFRVNQVRFEIDGKDGGRHRLKEEMEAIVNDVDHGRKEPSEFELAKTYCLAGQKVRIQDSAALIREISRGTIEWMKEDYWGYEVPTHVPGLDISRFDEKRYYTGVEIRKLNDRLRAERIEWLHSFDDLDPAIRNVFG